MLFFFNIYYAKVLRICVYISHKYLAYIYLLGHYQWICSFGKCPWIVCLKSTWRQWRIAIFISWLVYSTNTFWIPTMYHMLDYGNMVTSNIKSCLQRCCSPRRVSGPNTHKTMWKCRERDTPDPMRDSKAYSEASLRDSKVALTSYSKSTYIEIHTAWRNVYIHSAFAWWSIWLYLEIHCFSSLRFHL